jgi:hypothetical protein
MLRCRRSRGSSFCGIDARRWLGEQMIRYEKRDPKETKRLREKFIDGLVANGDTPEQRAELFKFYKGRQASFDAMVSRAAKKR